MAFARLTKFGLITAAVLVVVVGASVGVVLSISDNEIDLDEPKPYSVRLQELRALMLDNAIDAYIIPNVDSHQSEYLSAQDRRMAYISGFTGAGTSVVALDVAAVWTDSRYFIAAETQLDADLWTLQKSGNPGVPTHQEWLPTNDVVSRVGIDPFLIDAISYATLERSLESNGKSLVPIVTNLVDAVWTDKAPVQFTVIGSLAVEFSGKIASEKIAAVRTAMSELGGSALVVSALDEVAWLLNLRGSDVANTPVFFGYILLTDATVQLFIHENRVTDEIRQHFADEGVQVLENSYDNISNGINQYLTMSPTARIILPKTSQGITQLVPAARIIVAESPIVLLKIVKNPIEAEGMRNAHIRDGAAVIKYLHYLDTNVDAEVITEVSGAARLRQFREQGEHFKGLSFNSISAFGAHAALPHFATSTSTDVRITRNEIYLIDSGGQYLDGTTDITRTIHLGKPSAEEKDAFTRVLKGFISLARTVFPPRAPFSFFDAMARRALWDAGLDFGHGTGHGVGDYMGVHEFPPRIVSTNTAPGMVENLFTSNEPGYYLENFYGIRIEDVVQVVPLEAGRQLRGDFNGLGVLQFYDITMAPIQIKLIDVELLTVEEVDWLNEFHARVREKTQSLLEPVVYDWLVTQTEPIIARDSFDLRCSSTC